MLREPRHQPEQFIIVHQALPSLLKAVILDENHLLDYTPKEHNVKV